MAGINENGTITLSLIVKDLMSGNIGKAIGNLDKLAQKGGLVGSVAQGVGQSFGQMLNPLNLMSKGLGFATDVMGDSLTAASNMAESVSKVGVVFGDSASEIMQWSKTSATAMGTSQQAALEAAGTLGNLLLSMGNTSEKAADMSQTMVQLAADLGSFNNVGIEEVLMAMRSGLTGEIAPLRRFGVNLTDVALKAKAVSQGLWDGKGAISSSAKATAAYQLILEQTTTAQGDFARTSKGVANSQKILDANMANLSATMGKMLQGPVAGFLGFFNDILAGTPPIVSSLTAVTEQIKEQTAAIKEQARVAAEAANGGLSQLDANWKHFYDARSSYGRGFGVLAAQFVEEHETMAKAVGSSADEVIRFYQAEMDAGRTHAQANANYAKAWIMNFEKLPGQLGAVWTRLTTNSAAATGELVGDLAHVAGRTRATATKMLRTMDEAKDPWRTAWRHLAKWAKDPFRPGAFEDWIKGRSKAAVRKAEDAAEKGRPGVARRWRAIARAMRSPVTAQLVKMGDDVDTAIAKVMALQALAKKIEPHAIIVTGAGLGNNAGSGGAGGGGDGYRPPARASGGPVSAGGAYLVGEAGPELLQMGSQSGNVVPNGKLGGTTVNVYWSSLTTPSPLEMQRVARMLAPELARAVG